MQLKYITSVGTIAFDNNSNHIKVGSTVRWNKGNLPLSQVNWIDVSGDLLGSDQNSIIQAENALKTALAVQYGDLIFYGDDNTTIAEGLISRTSITGVRCVEGPTFKDTYGPQFATLRSYQFRFEAEYTIAGAASYISFTEALSFRGGLPQFAMRLALDAPPQRQMVWPATPYVVEQSGSAEGYLAYPPMPSPKFPFALKEAGDTRYLDPTRKGPNGWEGWPISWRYNFEWASPLVGFPQVWNF